MSTKIYNGYRIKKPENIDDLFDLFSNLRKDFNDTAQDIVNNLSTRLVVSIIDRLSIGIDTSIGEKNPIYTKDNDGNIKNLIYLILIDKMASAFESTKRDPIYDISIEGCVMKSNKDKEHLYFTFYFEKKEYKEIIEKYFDHYPYWDNADPPKGVTWDEWSAVGDIWLDILDDYSSPSEKGLTMNFIHPYKHPNTEWEVVSKSFPSKEERAASMAKRIIQEIVLEEKVPREKRTEKEYKEKIMSEIVKTVDEVNEGIHDERMEKIRLKLMELMPDLTEDTDLDLNIYGTYFKEMDYKKIIS